MNRVIDENALNGHFITTETNKISKQSNSPCITPTSSKTRIPFAPLTPASDDTTQPLDGFNLLLSAASTLPNTNSNLHSLSHAVMPPSPPTTLVDHTAFSNNVKGESLLLTGSYSDPVIFGRGGNSGFRIGKGNKQISREHGIVKWNHKAKKFRLFVKGMNGAMVDSKFYGHGEIVNLKERSHIDIIGVALVFSYPSNQNVDETKQSSTSNVISNEIEMDPLPNISQNSSMALNPKFANDKTDETLILPRMEMEKKLNMNLDTEDLVVTNMNDKPLSKPDSDTITVEICTLDCKDSALGDIFKNGQGSDSEANLVELIVQALVFSRKSSQTLQEICDHITTTQPTIEPQKCLHQIEEAINTNACFGTIIRKGKTADGTPKANQYYYVREKDPVEWRKQAYVNVSKNARSCTLEDKTYFWKIPGKPQKRSNNRRKDKESNELEPIGMAMTTNMEKSQPAVTNLSKSEAGEKVKTDLSRKTSNKRSHDTLKDTITVDTHKISSPRTREKRRRMSSS